jgi:GNAT superfamily N-acetyltransferase
VIEPHIAEQTRRMQALVAELWHLDGPRVDHHIGDLAWQRFQHVGREDEWRIQVWEEDGNPVAWAWLRAPGTLLHEIHPRHRGEALHAELLDWFETETEGEELRATSPSTSTVTLAFLRSRGYEVDSGAQGLVYHLTELAEIPEPTVPEGYRLRTVGPGDLERRVEIHRVVWAPSRVTAESFENVQAAWPYREDVDCVVEGPDGSFAAYCLAWLDEENRVGELEPVGTHPDHRRRGLATAVCRFAHHRLRNLGAERAIVYSQAGSEATALYESIGMREHARSAELVKRR